MTGHLTMRKRYQYGRQEGGFAIIDVIITIVVASLLSIMLAQFMGTGIINSGNPFLELKDDYALAQVMERFTADYRNALETSTLNDAFFEARDTAAEINSLYGVAVDSVSITATNFEPDDPIDPVDYTESGSDNGIRKVTITKDNQKLISLFTQ